MYSIVCEEGSGIVGKAVRPAWYDARAACQPGERCELALIPACSVARSASPTGAGLAGSSTLYDARAACQAVELALISTCYVAPPASPNGAGKHNALSHAASSHHLSCHIIIIIMHLQAT